MSYCIENFILYNQIYIVMSEEYIVPLLLPTENGVENEELLYG